MIRRRLVRLLPRRVRVHSPQDVTTISACEVDARAAGLRRGDVDAIWRSVVRYYRTGLQPAMALCVRRRGHVVLDRAIGHARGNEPDAGPDAPRELATPETLFNFFSGAKSLLAVLVLMASERGQVRLDDPVARTVPEFGRHGKLGITVRQVLTHQAGIALTPPELVSLDLLDRWDEVIAHICDLAPTTRPGSETAYHALTGGFVLAEVLRRATGRDVRALLDEELRGPLGFRGLSYGVPPELVARVAHAVPTGPVAGFPAAQLFQRSLGATVRRMVELSNDPRFLTALVPSANLVATANEVSRFFELLRRGGELDGVRVLRPDTIEQARVPHNTTYVDWTIMLPFRYGLGIMLGDPLASLFGVRSAGAFGHLGFSNVIAWADVERDLAVALMNNGKPLYTLQMVLWLDIMRTIAAVVPRDGRGAVGASG